MLDQSYEGEGRETCPPPIRVAVPVVGPVPHRKPVLPLPGNARLSLHKDNLSVSLEMAQKELELGLLIGRADNSPPSFQSLLMSTISRAHLLVLKDQGGFHAFDLCSTNGTYHAGQQVRECILSPDGAELMLSSEVRMEWHPLRLLN